MAHEDLAQLDPAMVMTKESPEPAGEKTNKAPAFKGGFHFIIITKQKLVLDYPIGNKKSKTAEDTSQSPGSKEVSEPDTSTPLTLTKDALTSQVPAKLSSKAKYGKTIGPLTIRNIACRFADDTLSIIMDATFAFGPVALDLLDFTLGLHLQGGLRRIKSSEMSGSTSPLITISGAFLYEKQDKSEYFASGLTVGFAPWLFKAAEFNGAMDIGKGEQLKCFFMYAMPRGPIISFTFAEVSAITAAFRYNIDLTLPTVDKLTEFPLLAPHPAVAKSPLGTVRDLLPTVGERNPYFNPLDDTRWLAAGLTATAF
ncbi:hypothetical protein LY78DRAFT_686916 [Colletotrichum sublineola]|nr:hypothetical protein LY78DRAFT_686916 [Colletotrichum sublineola]